MIRTIFTTANNLAKRFRYSPTAVIEGRQVEFLGKRVELQQKAELEATAREQYYKAKIGNTESVYEREKLEVVKQFANHQSSLNFQEAARRIDEIDQREANENLRSFWEQKKWRE